MSTSLLQWCVGCPKSRELAEVTSGAGSTMRRFSGVGSSSTEAATATATTSRASKTARNTAKRTVRPPLLRCCLFFPVYLLYSHSERTGLKFVPTLCLQTSTQSSLNGCTEGSELATTQTASGSHSVINNIPREKAEQCLPVWPNAANDWWIQNELSK